MLQQTVLKNYLVDLKIITTLQLNIIIQLVLDLEISTFRKKSFNFHSFIFFIFVKLINIKFRYDVKAGFDFYRTPPVITLTNNIILGVNDGPALLIQGAACTNNNDLVLKSNNIDY